MQQTAFSENYGTTIKSADEKAAQILRKLEELEQHAVDATTEPRAVPSSFRQRLTAARTRLEG